MVDHHRNNSPPKRWAGRRRPVAELLGAIGDIAVGQPMARAAVEMACWDLAARRAGLPLAGMLGGTRTGRRRDCAGNGRDHGGTAAAVRPMPFGVVTSGSSSRFNQGPISTSFEPFGRGSAIRIALTVDGNGAYTRDDFDHLAGLDEFGLQMIEQPLARRTTSKGTPTCNGF